MTSLRNIATFACVAALLAYFWWQGERFIATNGPTFDEGVYLVAGYAQWEHGDFTLNHENPPLMKWLWALPLACHDQSHWPADHATPRNHWHLADAFLYRSQCSPQQLLNPARRVTLAFGCGVAVLIGWWAYRAWSSRSAGLVAMAFAVCDPNLLAFSCVLSTDLGLTFFTVLSTYCLWEYTASRSRGLLLASGIALGCLLSTKFSALAVIVSLGVAGLVYLLLGGELTLPKRATKPDLRSRLIAAFDLVFRLGLIALATVAATYGIIHFNEWGAGLKFQLTRGDFGDGLAYLNGELSRTGWFHYFLIALALKLPLGLQLAALFGVLCRPVAPIFIANRANTLRIVSFFLLPPLVFLTIASLARVNLGIRLVLPVLPFLYLFASRLAVPGTLRVLRSILLCVCLMWTAFAGRQAAPHQLAYLNELAGGPRRGLNSIADSNVDWGQGLPLLKQYMDHEGIEVVYLSYFGTDHPEAHGIRYQALPGYGHVGDAHGERIPADAPRHVVVISANHLVGLMLNRSDTFAWLRNREPDAILGGCLYLFDLTGDADAIRRVR